MPLSLVGFFLVTLGEIMIGYTVIKVHGRVAKEHKIDNPVISEMSRERKIAISGIVLIILGFILQLPEKFL
ncbi:hypothetical protein HYU92_00255 [Candidatus Curtissbacteria bacterium]|nr:hypothetical protein [Candidatus Curtissbacteria bacterium]